MRMIRRATGRPKTVHLMNDDDTRYWRQAQSPSSLRRCQEGWCGSAPESVPIVQRLWCKIAGYVPATEQSGVGLARPAAAERSRRRNSRRFAIVLLFATALSGAPPRPPAPQAPDLAPLQSILRPPHHSPKPSLCPLNKQPPLSRIPVASLARSSSHDQAIHAGPITLPAAP